MRDNRISNRVLTSLDDIMDNSREAWKELTDQALAHHVHRPSPTGTCDPINELWYWRCEIRKWVTRDAIVKYLNLKGYPDRVNGVVTRVTHPHDTGSWRHSGSLCAAGPPAETPTCAGRSRRSPIMKPTFITWMMSPALVPGTGASNIA